MPIMDIGKLSAWFSEEKRSFPWREACDPYAVWVSEIMLQQTLASVVVPYFQRWMALFPNIPSLAHAEKDAVVKAWEGLGYYSRARNLHEGAKHVLKHHDGIMPSTKTELLAIPGIGEYTAGAILNFAFQKKAPAVDGNVSRVIARFLAIKKQICLPAVKKDIQSYVEAILPDKDPQVVSEALIELGALVCKKKPECSLCPLRQGCLAYQNGEELELPIVKPREKTIFLNRIVLIIEHVGFILVKKESETKVMQDLYEFPFVEANGDVDKALSFFQDTLNLKGALIKELPQEKHTFTKYRVTLYPFLFSAFEKPVLEGYQWVSVNDLNKLPFSSGHRRLLQRLHSNTNYVESA